MTPAWLHQSCADTIESGRRRKSVPDSKTRLRCEEDPYMIGHNISLLIADVDGSLVNEDKVLTPRAQAAVKALNAADIAFAITSGRPPRGMAMLFEPLALRTPIAGFNGGIFVKPDMT